MAKSKHPVEIMNLMADAADKKSRMAGIPDDENDPANSIKPKAKVSPASVPSHVNPDPDNDGDNDLQAATDTDHDVFPVKGKQVAAMKEQQKGRGKMPPKMRK